MLQPALMPPHEGASSEAMLEASPVQARQSFDTPIRRKLAQSPTRDLSAWQAATMVGRDMGDLLGAAGCLVAEVPVRLVSLALLGTKRHNGLLGSLAPPLEAACRFGGKLVGGLVGVTLLPDAVARGGHCQSLSRRMDPMGR